MVNISKDINRPRQHKCKTKILRVSRKPVTNFKSVGVNETAVLYRKCNLKILGSIPSLSQLTKRTLLLKMFLVVILLL
jgi:hypothetical protein